MAEKGRFQGGFMAQDESKFENPLIGSFRETSVGAHFSRKLQRIFPLPANSSEPENVRVLLRMIQAKVDNPPVPGETSERSGIEECARGDVGTRAL